MSSKCTLLLKTMWASTSRINVLKHTKDSKKHKSASGALVGQIVLAVLCVLFCGAIAFGLSFAGVAWVVPLFVASAISMMTLLFTFLKSNAYLYGFKEYDMLMSLPFSVKTVVADRFLLMYLKDLMWDALISLSCLAGYAVVVKPGVWVYVAWILMTPFVPLLPMVIASLIGVFIADLGSRFRHKKLIQTILTFIFVIPLIFSRFIIDYLIRNDKVKEVVEASGQALDGIARYIPTIRWFGEAINDGRVLSFVLVIAVSLAVFTGEVFLISITYRRINSALASSGVKRKKAKTGSKAFRKRNVIGTVAFKEFKRITGSTVCATNLGMGAVIGIIAGLILPFININSIITAMTGGHEIDISPYVLAWPVIVYFFMGMVPTTAPSPSLEGKNYWIIKSLPVDMLTVCKGKMLFNIYMNMIPGLFVTITGFIALRAGALEFILGILMVIAMGLFSTVFGMRCGLKHMNLDWENEVQVVKQGKAVSFYLLPNMFSCMFLVPLAGVLGYFNLGALSAVIIIVVYGLLALWSYSAVKRFSAQK